jgi:hypothetical protein
VKGFAQETKELAAADLLISTTDFIVGVILIYHCWLLWSKNYRVMVLSSLAAIAGSGEFLSKTIRKLPAITNDSRPSRALFWFRSMPCRGSCLGSSLSIQNRQGSPQAPPRLLSLADFVLPLCSNVIVDDLTAVRILYLSLRKTRDIQFDTGRMFPADTGQATIDIVVESGTLYLVVQFIFLVLFVLGHPA